MKNKIKILFVIFLMLAAAIIISAGDIIMKSGTLDVSDDFAVDTDTFYVDSANNKVGIGTSTPSYPLDVAGDTRFYGSSGVRGFTIGSMASDDSSGKGMRFFYDFNNDQARLYARDYDIAEYKRLLLDGSTLALNSYGGNVGIGTTEPSYKLDVNGDLRIYGTSGIRGFTVGSVASDDSSGTGVKFWYDFDRDIARMFSRNFGASSYTPFYIDASTLVFNKWGGKVGIGTDEPAEKLHVAGAVKTTELKTGDITFNKDGNKPVWRMFEDEDGLYVESLTTGKNYRLVLEEIK